MPLSSAMSSIDRAGASKACDGRISACGQVYVGFYACPNTLEPRSAMLARTATLRLPAVASLKACSQIV